MQDVMFVLKCLVVTVVILVSMQLRIGHQTAEGYVMSWIHHSSVSHTLQDVAEGAVKAGKNGKDAVMGFIGSNDSANEPVPTEASTGGWFKIKRSAAYYRQKEHEQKRDSRKAHAKSEDQARLNEGADDESGSDSKVDNE
jgi:hypothetical protein